MTANENTGSAGKNPADSNEDEDRVEHTSDYTGAGRARVDPGSPVRGDLDLYSGNDDRAMVECLGHYYEDKSPQVVIRIRVAHANATLTVSPERARGIAEELRLAATHAEDGARELGWSE